MNKDNLLKKICLPVVGSNLQEFLTNLKESQKIVDLVELRVDYIRNLKIEDLKIIRKILYKRGIFTCRKKEEGGQFLGEERQRLAIIKKGLMLNFDFVDIELSTLENEEIDNFSNKKTSLIVSYHNFSETPFEWELRKLIWYMEKFGEIVKIATLVKEDYDNLKLFRLMLNKKADDKRIIIGMGKKGKITRILGPILGSFITYSSSLKEKTAPGQIEYFQLKKIYENLLI